MTDEVVPAAAPVIQEFPKMLYHPDGVRRIVANQDEQDALGGAWGEAPFEPVAPAAEEPPPATEPPPNP